MVTKAVYFSDSLVPLQYTVLSSYFVKFETFKVQEIGLRLKK